MKYFTKMKVDFFRVLLLFAINFVKLNDAENAKLTPECATLNVLLKQNIQNDGFHKDVELNINFMDDKIIFENDCKISVKVYTSNGFFINPDEMQELKRLKKISAIIDKSVDIEAPAHESIGHETHIFVNSSKNIQINYGIHLRYHRAQILGGDIFSYIKVPLKQPKILIQCPKIEICGENIIAPCDEAEQKPCNWKDVSYKAEFSPTELQVPVGDLDDYPLVAIISLSLGCAGTLYLLSLLDTTML